MLRYTGYALVVVVLAAVSSEAFLNGAGSASATQSAASATPMRLKGGLVERCTSDKDVGKIAESKEMAELNHVHQSIIVDATPAECFAAASAFEDYPKWAGAMKKVNVLKRSGGLGTAVEWTMGILNLVDRPVFVYEYSKSNTEMKWHVREPSKTIKNLMGRYNFETVSNSKAHPQTKVLYKLNVEPYVPFPAFVKKVINAAVARQALKELKHYTEKQRKLGLEAQSPSGGDTRKDSAGFFAYLKTLVFGCFGA